MFFSLLQQSSVMPLPIYQCHAPYQSSGVPTPRILDGDWSQGSFRCKVVQNLNDFSWIEAGQIFFKRLLKPCEGSEAPRNSESATARFTVWAPIWVTLPGKEPCATSEMSSASGCTRRSWRTATRCGGDGWLQTASRKCERRVVRRCVCLVKIRASVGGDWFCLGVLNHWMLFSGISVVHWF